MSCIKLVKANVLEYSGIEAIVNSTNERFRGRGGLDAAIHERAGKALDKECKKIGKALPMEAHVFPGFNLNYDYVISIVLPNYKNDELVEMVLDDLERCYREVLDTAMYHGIKSVAFPSLGTKEKKFPDTIAAKIAVEAVSGFLKEYPGSIDEVYFIVHESYRFKLYKKELENQGVEYININQLFKDTISKEDYVTEMSDSTTLTEDELSNNYDILCNDKKDIVIDTKAKFGLTGAEMENAIAIAMKAKGAAVKTKEFADNHPELVEFTINMIDKDGKLNKVSNAYSKLSGAIDSNNEVKGLIEQEEDSDD